MIAPLPASIDTQPARRAAASIIAFYEAIRASGIWGTQERAIEITLAWVAAGMPTDPAASFEQVPVCNHCGMPSLEGVAILWQDMQSTLVCAVCQPTLIREGWVRMEGLG